MGYGVATRKFQECGAAPRDGAASQQHEWLPAQEDDRRIGISIEYWYGKQEDNEAGTSDE
jgi:hypothetical protein